VGLAGRGKQARRASGTHSRPAPPSPVGRRVVTGRKDPRLGAGTVASAVHDPERDHRGDRCLATLATRDGQPSQPVVACPSVHAARLPRRTRSSPWLTGPSLSAGGGWSARLSWRPTPPVRAWHRRTARGASGPMCPRCRRAARRGLGHARPDAPVQVAGAAAVPRRPRSCHRIVRFVWNKDQ
jgi:hypothetical protein